MYSRYKATYTIKILVAITPDVSFLSKARGRRYGDSFITNDFDYLNKLEAENLVLVDKGFPGIKTNIEG